MCMLAPLPGLQDSGATNMDGTCASEEAAKIHTFEEDCTLKNVDVDVVVGTANEKFSGPLYFSLLIFSNIALR